MSKESTIQRSCIKYLREQGAAVYNIAGGPLQSRATPDLLVCYKGHFVGLECKQPGAKCTKLQVRELDRIDEAGGVAAVVHSKDECAQLLKALPGISWRRRKIATKPALAAPGPVKGPQGHPNKEKRPTAIVERPGGWKKKDGQGVLL